MKKTTEAIKNCETVSAIQKILMEKEIPPRVEYSLRDGKKLYEGFKSYAKMGRRKSSMIIRFFYMPKKISSSYLPEGSGFFFDPLVKLMGYDKNFFII